MGIVTFASGGSGTVAAQTATDAMTAFSAKIRVHCSIFDGLAEFTNRPVFELLKPRSGQSDTQLMSVYRGSGDAYGVRFYSSVFGTATSDPPLPLSALPTWMVFHVWAQQGFNPNGAGVDLIDPEAGRVLAATAGGYNVAMSNAAGSGAWVLHGAAAAGVFDGIAIYSQRLTGADRWRTPRLSDANLVSYFPFDRGSSTTPDAVPSRNTMALSSATLADGSRSPVATWSTNEEKGLLLVSVAAEAGAVLAVRSVGTPLFYPEFSTTTHDLTLPVVAGTNRQAFVLLASEGAETYTIAFDPAGVNVAGSQVASHTTTGTKVTRLFRVAIPDGVNAGTYTVRLVQSAAYAGFIAVPIQTVNAASGAAEATAVDTAFTTDMVVTNTIAPSLGALLFGLSVSGDSGDSATWSNLTRRVDGGGYGLRASFAWDVIVSRELWTMTSRTASPVSTHRNKDWTASGAASLDAATASADAAFATTPTVGASMRLRLEG